MIEPVYVYRAAIVRVIDADTFVARIDLGFRCAVELEVRVRGIDAPELTTPEGKTARTWAVEVVQGGAASVAPAIVVESYHDRRSFARWVADVYVDGESYAELAVAAGQAIAV